MRMLPGIASIAIMWSVAGCSSDASRTGVTDDRYESTNRSFFASHQVLYRNVLRPVVVFYNHAVP